MIRFLKGKIKALFKHIKSTGEDTSSVSSVDICNELSNLNEYENQTDTPQTHNESRSELISTPTNPISNSSVKELQANPFVRTTTCVTNSFGLVIGASLQGKSHAELGESCQDFHLYEEIGDGWFLCVVSDGAGSAKLSARGSKGNCTLFAKLIRQLLAENKWIENNKFPSELEWYIQCRSMFEAMKLIYRNKAVKMDDQVAETDFNATIIVCLITPDGLLTAHIGDGRMGYQDENGEWHSLMTPHKGEEINQTIFLQNAWTSPQVPAMKVSGVFVPETSAVLTKPKAIVLITDGCERSTWQCAILNQETNRYEDLNLPYPAFFNPLIETIAAEQPNNRLNLLIDIMDKSTKSFELERDDKTMLLAISKASYDQVPTL